MYANRQFLIIPYSEVSKIDFTLVSETSVESLRKSADGQKTFIKFDGEVPQFVNTISNVEGPYTYENMLDILSTTDWFVEYSRPI
jgi:hypothetical protein